MPEPFWTIYGVVTTLTFDLLSSKFNRFIFDMSPNSSTLYKFGEYSPQQFTLNKLSLEARTDGQLENILPPAPVGVSGIKQYGYTLSEITQSVTFSFVMSGIPLNVT